MIVHITKKLAAKLKLNPPAAEEEEGFDELYSWRANVVEEGRYRIVVFMNDASRYVIVLNGIKAKDWPKLPGLFTQTLRQTLLAGQVNPEVVDRYLAEAGEVTYARNVDRQKTAWINKACDCACIVFHHHDDNVGLSLAASHIPVGTSNSNDTCYPNQQMLEFLQRYGLPVRKCRAFDMDVRLVLAGRYAMRGLRVPADITFERLHKVLQAAFGWKDYHLYSFMLFAEGKEGEEPAVELLASEEELEYSKNAKLMMGVKLSDYIPQYKHILYVYDYGDDWRHYIDVAAVLDECTDELPALLFGEGDAPPEDVGGPYGYEDFLAAINDPNHEDHKNMKEWSKSQFWERYEPQKIAQRLKYTLSW